MASDNKIKIKTKDPLLNRSLAFFYDLYCDLKPREDDVSLERSARVLRSKASDITSMVAELQSAASDAYMFQRKPVQGDRYLFVAEAIDKLICTYGRKFNVKDNEQAYSFNQFMVIEASNKRRGITSMLRVNRQKLFSDSKRRLPEVKVKKLIRRIEKLKGIKKQGEAALPAVRQELTLPNLRPPRSDVANPTLRHSRRTGTTQATIK